MGYGFFVEDASGNLDNLDPIQVRTTATTASDGTFTVDVTNASLSRVSGVYGYVLDSGTGVTSTTTVNFTTVNATTISGVVHQFTSILGVLGLTTVGSGVVVHIIAECDQS